MKGFVLAVTLASACFAAQLDRGYLPPIEAHSASSNPGALQAPRSSFTKNHNGHLGSASFWSRINFGQDNSELSELGNSGTSRSYGAPSGPYGLSSHHERYGAPERYQNSAGINAKTIHQDSKVTSDAFRYSFETDNGIRADASGSAAGGVRSSGGFGFKGDDGNVYSLRYTADEHGYRPEGAHLPTPPPIPEYILKSLQQNAREEADGNSSDGSYNEQKYSSKEYGPNGDAVSGNRPPSLNNGSFGSPSFTSRSHQPIFFQQNVQSQAGNFQKYNAPSIRTSEQSGELSYLPPNQSTVISSARYNSESPPQLSVSQQPAAHHQGSARFNPTSINSQLEGLPNPQFDGAFSSPVFGASSLSTQYGTPSSVRGSARNHFPSFNSESSPFFHAGAGVSPNSRSQYNTPALHGTLRKSSQSNSPPQDYKSPSSFGSAPSNQIGAPKARFWVSNSFEAPATLPQYEASHQQRPSPQYAGTTPRRPQSSQFASLSREYKSPSSFGSAPSNQNGLPKSQFEVYKSFGVSATSPQYGIPHQQGFSSSGSQRRQFGGPRDPPSFSPDSGYKY